MSDFVKARLKEPSTWRGMVLICTAFGVPIAPQMAEAIITIGLALSGGIGVLTSDSKP
jgi:hypothetical protein